jgi:hypothetical protein
VTHKTRKEVQQIKADLAARDAESIGGWDQMGPRFLGSPGSTVSKTDRFLMVFVGKSIGNKWTSVFSDVKTYTVLQLELCFRWTKGQVGSQQLKFLLRTLVTDVGI